MAVILGGAAVGRMSHRHSGAWAAAAASIFVAIVLIAFPCRSAAAAEGDVTLRLLPADVTLSPGERATVNLVISNTTSVPVRVVAVDIGVPAQVMKENVPSPESIGRIRAGGFVLRSFDLRAGAEVENGEIDILLRYRSESRGQEWADRFVAGSLTLTAGHAPQALQAAFLSFPDKLNDGQSAGAAVSISNPTPFPVEQVTVAAVNSENVTLSLDASVKAPFVACSGGTALGCLDMLAPGATAVLRLKMTASSRVQTGAQRVSVVVSSQTDTSGDPVASTVVATTPVQVTIFGVDALSPFGLGALFVVPGIVTVLVFLLMARYVYPRSKELPESVQFTDARVLLAVVPPAALAYLLVWVFYGVNLTDEAGTGDVVRLFWLGIVLGAIVWGVVAAIYFWRSGRKQFTASDTPKKVLKRLRARRVRLTLPVVASGNVLYRYLSDGPGGQLVACPPVAYAIADDAGENDGQRLRTALDTGDIDTVLREVRRRKVKLGWQRASGVTLLERSAVQIRDPDRLMVEALPGEV